MTYGRRWDAQERKMDELEVAEEDSPPSAYETHAKEMLRKPEYQRIRIGLERLNRSLELIENSWEQTSRSYTRKELENVLNRQHEIEKEAEGIEDMFLRGYIHEQLDSIGAIRRSLAEDVRWDIEAKKRDAVPAGNEASAPANVNIAPLINAMKGINED